MSKNLNLTFSILFLFVFLTSQKCTDKATKEGRKTDYDWGRGSAYPVSAIDFSQNMLLAIKSELPYDVYLDTLEEINLKELNKELSNQNKKLSFWINIYNSLVQVRLMETPQLFENKKEFFQNNDIVIGTEKLSLNDIENGIMRLKEDVTNLDFVLKFKLDHLDNRIHFTLNCGATSCPAIAYYSPEKLDTQLENATTFFVKNNCKYNESNNEVVISELFSWFKEDFNGEAGVIKFLQKHKLFPIGNNPKIKFKPYDWGVKPAKFN